MKSIATSVLIEELKADTRQIILQTNQLRQVDPETLLKQPSAGKWSITQVIEHLNAYGRYYLPAMNKAIDMKSYQPNASFKSGWLGNWFTNSMKPTPDQRIRNKMKAMKDYTPAPSLDSKTVIDEFLAQQQSTLMLLDKTLQTDPGRVKVAISIARFVTLKLGDTLRFNIAHNQRHLLQCQNILRELQSIRTVDSNLLNVLGSNPR